MGIYINGMNMPKGKPICIIIDPVGQVRRYDLNNDKYIDDELFEAIHVPSHGKLIDANALQKDWLENYRYALTYSIFDSLVNAPAIIPAEEDET